MNTSRRTHFEKLLLALTLVIPLARLGYAEPIGEAMGKAHELLKDHKSGAPAVGAAVEPGSNESRAELMRRAEVWSPTDVESADIAKGALGFSDLGPADTITCQYDAQRTAKAKTSSQTNTSSKFFCKDEKHGLFRVKYGDKEDVAQTAATKLAWALGFGADPKYNTTVKCAGCPDDPWKSLDPQGGGRGSKSDPSHVATFPLASVEFQMEKEAAAKGFTVKAIEEKEGQGWSFKEIDNMDGNIPDLKTHRDGLKLLGVFLQHVDNATRQQRLVCLRPRDSSPEAPCPKPFMYIEDLGSTFGASSGMHVGQNGKFSLSAWISNCVWSPEAPGRIGHLPGIKFHGSTLVNPEISDAGRQFLGSLLGRLSQDQIRQLFETAGVEAFSQTPEGGGAGVAAWVEGFNLRVKEIQEGRCLDAERSQLQSKVGTPKKK